MGIFAEEKENPNSGIGMASTTRGPKAEGPQLVQTKDELQVPSPKCTDGPSSTKAVEPNNGAPPPHEAAEPSLESSSVESVDLNENSDGDDEEDNDHCCFWKYGSSSSDSDEDDEELWCQDESVWN